MALLGTCYLVYNKAGSILRKKMQELEKQPVRISTDYISLWYARYNYLDTFEQLVLSCKKFLDQTYSLQYGHHQTAISLQSKRPHMSKA